MNWWQDNLTSGTGESVGPDRPIGLPVPSAPVPPVPEGLADLLEFSLDAARCRDHLSSWRAVTALARHHWMDAPPPDGISDGVSERAGEWHALRNAVAEQLDMPEEAAESRQEWLEWAQRAGDTPAQFHVRAFVAFAEADAVAGQSQTAPADAELPETLSLLSDLAAWQRPTDGSYRASLAATIAASAAGVASRGDLARRFGVQARRLAPIALREDDLRLLDAQLAHRDRDLRRAATICADVADHPAGEPVTTVLDARQMLGYLSLEAGEEDEAIAQFDAVVRLARRHDVVVAGLSSCCLLASLLGSHGRRDEATYLAREYLAAAEGMPVCGLLLDLRLILARGLVEAGDYREAWEHVEAVAHWSQLTEDTDRTVAAFTVAAIARQLGDDCDTAAERHIELAEHLGRGGDTVGRSRALRQAARTIVESPTLEHRRRATEWMTQSLVDIAESDDWERGDWHDDMAFVQWSLGEGTRALDHVHQAAEGYLAGGDSAEAARALLTGVRCCLDADDSAGVLLFTSWIDQLLPADRFSGHPVREHLDFLLQEDLPDEDFPDGDFPDED